MKCEEKGKKIVKTYLWLIFFNENSTMRKKFLLGRVCSWTEENSWLTTAEDTADNHVEKEARVVYSRVNSPRSHLARISLLFFLFSLTETKYRANHRVHSNPKTFSYWPGKRDVAFNLHQMIIRKWQKKRRKG